MPWERHEARSPPLRVGLDALRTAGVVALLSFKPSEPHLTKYLSDVKGLSDKEVNDAVYPVGTYAQMLILVVLVVLKATSYGSQSSWKQVVTDKQLIIFGCCGRLATRLLLLFGEGLRAMQLMQVTYSLGTIAELVLYAYALKVVPAERTQTLAAVVQAAYLMSHTSASLIGDALLANTQVGLRGLMWISATSVSAAVLLSLSLRDVDTLKPPQLAQPFATCRAAYQARGLWVLTPWWVLNYAVYMSVYGYETSLYDALFGARPQDHNGTIFAAGLLVGAAAGLPLTLPSVRAATGRCAPGVFALAGAVMVAATFVMVWIRESELALGVAFATFLMAWSFANALFYGETRRAVDDAVTGQQSAPLLLDMQSLNEVEREAVVLELVSLVCVANSGLGAVATSLFTLGVFSAAQLDVVPAFEVAMALGVLSSGATLGLWLLHRVFRSAAPGPAEAPALGRGPAPPPGPDARALHSIGAERRPPDEVQLWA